jgi:hypothetical protein
MNCQLIVHWLIYFSKSWLLPARQANCIFSKTCNPGLTQPTKWAVGAFYEEVQSSVCAAGHSPPSDAEVDKA